MSDPDIRHAAEEVADDTTSQDLEPAAPEATDLPPLRSYNVFATFDDAEAARESIIDLERTGIDAADVSALVLDTADEVDLRDGAELQATGDHDADVMETHVVDVAKGGGIGAVAGALGSAAVTLAIPGVGAAIGAGILAVSAGGAMAGAGVGAFAGAVTGTPASKGWERAIADLQDGRVVVGVHSNEAEHHNEAMSVLANAGAISVRELDDQGEPV